SHPRDFGRDIVEAIESNDRICNHVHLPVQSNSTHMLRTMQRTYSRDKYLEKIAMIRESKKHIAITSDIIVSFPGETEREFDETLELMETVKYEGIFA